MIVMTIAFGELFIRRLFERCLPSLLTPGNLPSLQSEPLELAIFTFSEDLPRIQEYVDKSKVAGTAFPGTIQVFTFQKPAPIDSAVDVPRTQIYTTATYQMLCQALQYCIQKDQIFFMAVPDLIYSDGLVRECYDLHKLTHKVVLVFNGRIRPNEGSQDFLNQDLLDAAKRLHGLRDLFFWHMEQFWRNWSTTDPEQFIDAVSGKLIYFAPRGTYIFMDTPNPTLGKFTVDDLVFFSESKSGLQAWDRLWRDHLLQSGRALVQPNIDLFMSVEPEEPDIRLKLSTDTTLQQRPMKRSLTGKLGLGDSHAARRSKFTFAFGHFTFTSAYIKKS